VAWQHRGERRRAVSVCSARNPGGGNLRAGRMGQFAVRRSTASTSRGVGWGISSC
jgi:hypothetical protein